MPELLRIERLVAGYGEAQVLAKVDLTLEEGKSLALLGRNGAGKTTLLDTIVGVTTYHAGTIRLHGRDVSRLSAERRAPLGIGWVPQERNIFRSLTVEENLTATARPGGWDLGRVYGMFPRLKERRRNLGNQLSGGEQQMLAVGRALMLNPKILLLDEPLEGLAPIIVDELLAALRGVVTGEGMSAIIVEQKARKVLPLTDDVIVLERGIVVYRNTAAALLASPETLDAHLSV
ncbi:ABC transporter ATP-binding protein [Mesorhizobium sp. L-8-10]|uniref:ABC transporter ATP-binding protein n=1 Tax=Mesorhizobium sp. L-8-10 TaxID=2744523 RepID=UPI0019261C59|nr:ABC transporter ATP-binding protein [Mesorhizobium sp. L-8-10]BCH30686.1 ABC transporter ATP-binding protein [Mesorhizobium sp. L-8-10]